MAASTSPLASMAGAFVRVSSVMAILPCEAAVVPAQRHARVYSSESARTKPPTAPCRSQGGPPCGMPRAGLGCLVVFLRRDELERPHKAVHDDIVARDAGAALDERRPGPFLLPCTG